MHAFVPNTSLGVSKMQLRTSLQNICGSSLREVAPVSRRNAVVSMSGDKGITLQTLVYTPNTTFSGTETKDVNCTMVWKQVFGNAYVMESERADAYVAESMYRAGQISLKEFVRGVALSATYRRRFFDCCGPYRAVELNFKHLLGRGPISQEEVSEHVQRIANEGFEAEINSYIDSEEYEEAFGIDLVPYYRFKGTYATIEEFNRMCMMAMAPGRTDKSLVGRAKALGIDNPNHVLSLDGAGISSRLASIIAGNGKCSFLSIGGAIPSRPDLDLRRTDALYSDEVVNENAVSGKRRVEISMGNYIYLSAEESEEYLSSTLEKKKISGLVQQEIVEAEQQISLLQKKVAELSLAQ